MYPLLKITSGSFTKVLVLLIVLVLPETVRFPTIAILELIVTSGLNNDPTIVPGAIFTLAKIVASVI